MQPLSGGLRETIGEGGTHDGAVIVAGRFETMREKMLLMWRDTKKQEQIHLPLAQLVTAETGGYGEHADVVLFAGGGGGHEVGDALVVLLGGLGLLPQTVQGAPEKNEH